MKKRILLSILAGFIIATVSLLYKSGTGPEPMPYVGGGYGIANGIVVSQPSSTPSSPTLAKRGWPLPIASIASENDDSGEFYKSLIIKNLLIDILLYTALAYGVLTLLSFLKKPKPTTT